MTKLIISIILCFLITTVEVSAQKKSKNLTWEDLTLAYKLTAEVSLDNLFSGEELQAENEKLTEFIHRSQAEKGFNFTNLEKQKFIKDFKKNFPYFSDDFYQIVAVKHAALAMKQITDKVSAKTH
ncbi:MAG: hypothetical protein AAF600_22585 [Bacteroidota bacterium]